MPIDFNNPRLDASESMFAQRELEFVQQAAYAKRYPNLQVASGDILPINTSMPAWAEVGVYYMIDMVGAAKVIDNYGQNLPRANVKKTEHTWRAKRFGIAYGFTLDDMKKAAALGIPLEAAEAMAARRAYDELADGIGTDGDDDLGLVGFMGLTNTTSYSVANGAGGSQTFALKTPDEILADMNGIADNIVETTNGVGSADTWLLPLEQFNLIARTRLGDGSDTTILKHFLDVRRSINPGATVKPWWRLSGAGSGPSDRMVCYRRDPEVVEWYVPEMFNQLAPDVRNGGMETVINCTGKIGSVVSRYPFEISFGDGI